MDDQIRPAVTSGIHWQILNIATGEIVGNFYTPEALAARLRGRPYRGLEVIKLQHGELIYKKTSVQWLLSEENPDTRRGHVEP